MNLSRRFYKFSILSDGHHVILINLINHNSITFKIHRKMLNATEHVLAANVTALLEFKF